MAPQVIFGFDGAYRFLSNFFVEPCGVTVEHRFQSSKPLDPSQRLRIMAALTPGKAKELGRRCDLRPDWEIVKVQIMAEAVAEKFRVRKLAEALAATAPIVLVESNSWHDNEWGDCVCGRPACAAPGLNLLGAILMATRATLVRTGVIPHLT